MTIRDGTGGAWWFNGLPFQRVVPKSSVVPSGTQKYWFNGLPVAPYGVLLVNSVLPGLLASDDSIPVSYVGPFPTQLPAPGLVAADDVFFAPSVSFKNIPWTPAVLSTVVLWLKADTLTGNTGDAISTWPDVSGLSHDATQSGSNRPLLQVAHQNGLNVVKFTAASSHYFNLPDAFQSLTEGAVAFVSKLNTDPPGNPLGNDGPVVRLGSWIIDPAAYPYGGDSLIYSEYGSNARHGGVTHPGTSMAVYNVAGFRAKSADWRYNFNGTQVYSTGTNTVGWTTTPYIGRGTQSFGPPNYLDGFIGEIVKLNEFASTLDWQRTEGYLAWKWGTQADLATTHPYYFNKPAFQNLIDHDDTFFAPLISQGASVGAFNDFDSFYQPTITASITLLPSLYSDTDTFFSPTIASTDTTLLPSLYSDTNTFYAPTIVPGSVSLLPSLYSDTDTIYSPTQGAFSPVAPSLYDDTDTFYAPSIAAIDFVLPTLVTDTDTFFAPLVVAIGQVFPSLVTDADSFFAPTVVPGPVTLLPSLFNDAAIFYSPSIAATDFFLPALYSDTDTFFAPTVSHFSGVLPGLVTDDDTLYAPLIIHDLILQPPFINSDVVFYLPTDAAIYTISASLVVDVDTIYAPSLAGGPITILPSRYVDPDIFPVPFVGLEQSNGNGGGHGQGNVPANIKYVTKITMTQSGLILSLDAIANANKVMNSRMVIYSDVAGVPTTLLGQTNVNTAVVSGTNHYILQTGVSVLNGQVIWVGVHSDGDFKWLLDHATNGSKFNTDTFSDGPSNPFGPVSNDNKQAPVVVYYLLSANATVTMGTYTDTDVFYAPSIGGRRTLTAPFLVDTDFFYAPAVIPFNYIAPTLLVDTDTFYAPTTTKGDVTLLPPLVSDETIYSPDVGSFPLSIQNVFSAPVSSDDVIYAADVFSDRVVLSPSLFVDTDAVFSPDVAAFSPTIFSAPFDSDDVFYAPTVTPDRAVLLPSLVASDDIVYSANVGQVNTPVQNVFSAPVPSDDVFYADTVSLLGANLPPPLVDSDDDVLPPVVLNVNVLLPSLLITEFNDDFFVPTISLTGVPVTPDLSQADDTIYSPQITTDHDNRVLSPSLFVDTDVFYTARRVSNKSWRRQVYVAGTEVKTESVVGSTAAVSVSGENDSQVNIIGSTPELVE